MCTSSFSTSNLTTSKKKKPFFHTALCLNMLSLKICYFISTPFSTPKKYILHPIPDSDAYRLQICIFSFKLFSSGMIQDKQTSEVLSCLVMFVCKVPKQFYAEIRKNIQKDETFKKILPNY